MHGIFAYYCTVVVNYIIAVSFLLLSLLLLLLLSLFKKYACFFIPIGTSIAKLFITLLQAH